VLAGKDQREVDRLEVVAADDLRHLPQPRLEQPLDLRERTKLGVVVEVDVRDDGDPRTEPLDRPVRLVPFHDEPPRPGPRVPAQLRHLAADQKGRVPPEPVEDVRDHRRRRRLPVRACDDDRVLQRDELGQELRAGATRHAPREGRGDDRLEAVRRRRRLRLDRHRNASRADVLQVGRLDSVPTPHLGSPRLGEDCIAGEAGTADADEPQTASLKRRGQ
jgi:hypothetical protein